MEVSLKSEVLKDRHFRVNAVPPGSALLVGDVAVFNVGGNFCATQAKCTHRQGPLSEGKLDGSTVTSPDRYSISWTPWGSKSSPRRGGTGRNFRLRFNRQASCSRRNGDRRKRARLATGNSRCGHVLLHQPLQTIFLRANLPEICRL